MGLKQESAHCFVVAYPIMLGFAGQMVSVTTTQLCSYRITATTDNTEMKSIAIFQKCCISKNIQWDIFF